MKPKRAVKELEKQLRKDPDNLVVRLRLAAALREVGKTARAVELYRSVAAAYHAGGRFSQAMAVCKSVLEIDPSQRETQLLLADIETRVRTQAAQQAQAEAAAAQRGQRSEDSSRARPVSGVPPLRRQHSSDGPPSGDFSARSGLTPVSDELPSLSRSGRASAAPASSPPGQPSKRKSSDRLIASGSRPPGVRSSRRVPVFRDGDSADEVAEKSTTRPSFGITPLPAPLAAHEAEDGDTGAMDSEPRIQGGTLEGGDQPRNRRLPPPLPTPTPTPVRVGPSGSQRQAPPPTPRGASPAAPRAPAAEARQVDDDAPTTIAAEHGWRPAGTPMATREAPRLADDPARDTPAPAARAAPLRASPPRPAVDRAPRLRGSLAAANHAGAGADDEAPTERQRLVPRDELALADDGGDGPTNPGYQRPNPALEPGADLDGMPTNPRVAPARRAHERATQPAVPSGRAAVASRDWADGTAGEDEYDPTRIEDPPHTLAAHREYDDGGATDEIPRVDLDGIARKPRDLDDGPRRDNIRLPSAFERSFEPVLDDLTPDGAVIDVPRNVFAELPEDAVAELVRRMVVRRFDANDLIIREGEPGEACFVISSGAVRVLKRDPTPDTDDFIEVARLGPGAVVGEFALLADRRRHATVQAVEESELYEIPRRVLRELAANYPGVGPALERFYRQRLLSTLIATAPFLAPLPEEERLELLARFVPRHCSSGQEIVQEGTSAGGLYLIVMGSVEITKRVPRQRAVVLATLGEGTYFGELSLMRGGAAQATVTATGPTELAVLPPKDFYDIVGSNPVLWEAMRREARRRELAIAEIVAGESGSV